MTFCMIKSILSSIVFNCLSLILNYLKNFKMFQRNIQTEKFTPLLTEKNMKTSDSEIDFQETETGWLRSWLQWCPTSMSLLAAAEKRILSYVRTPIVSRYVNVGPVVGKEDCKIWTLSMNEKSEKTPLILLHGLGSGVALWSLNLDSFAKTRPVYAFDFLGFGRSSRPEFSSDALEAEKELVTSIEEWRKEMKLDKFVILGHSMGGFLATSYAIHYPERVAHLVLADPWGFPEKPADISQRYPIPLWVKAIAYVLQPLNPLWGIRLAGPLGPKLIEKVRPDLISKFAALTENEDVKIAEYIFHCNAQNPTGESAFHSMMSSFGWAKYPMSKRIFELHKEIPLTMVYGSRSWVDHSPGNLIQQMRTDSYVNVEVIQGAGHHVYADKKDSFNEIVLKSCTMADETCISKPKIITPKLDGVENQEIVDNVPKPKIIIPNLDAVGDQEIVVNVSPSPTEPIVNVPNLTVKKDSTCNEVAQS